MNRPRLVDIYDAAFADVEEMGRRYEELLKRLARLGFDEPTEDQTERARIELELTREKP